MVQGSHPPEDGLVYLATGVLRAVGRYGDGFRQTPDIPPNGNSHLNLGHPKHNIVPSALFLLYPGTVGSGSLHSLVPNRYNDVIDKDVKTSLTRQSWWKESPTFTPRGTVPFKDVDNLWAPGSRPRCRSATQLFTAWPARPIRGGV